MTWKKRLALLARDDSRRPLPTQGEDFKMVASRFLVCGDLSPAHLEGHRQKMDTAPFAGIQERFSIRRCRVADFIITMSFMGNSPRSRGKSNIPRRQVNGL